MAKSQTSMYMQLRISFILLSILSFSGCSNSGDGDIPDIALEDVTSEILNFEYIPDTGNNSSLLTYEIKLTNPNNLAVEGFYTVTLDANGTKFYVGSSTSAQCYQIEANSECINSYESEGIVDSEENANAIKIVAIDYEFVE
jgi:hypothetical protein